jgi:hypothetical protein
VWREGRRITPVEITPTLTGEPEYCLTCHEDLPEISPSHPVEAFGCVICHGGQPLALDADLAHSTMWGGRNPSRFEVVKESCGGDSCHSGSAEKGRDHIPRVLTSIQSTYAGAIANIRFSFGAQPDQTARQGIFAINDPDGQSSTGILSLSRFDANQDGSPPIRDFGNNCLTCHISSDPLPGGEYARLSGCAACHTLTSGLDLNPGSYRDSTAIHQLTTSIPYTQCNACHNRGNYDLGDMQFHPRRDHPVDRLNDYYQPIAQFVRCEWTLDCIDCHTRVEAMGDGDLHSSQADIQYVMCRTCHGTLEARPLTKKITNEEDISLRMAFLNPVIDLKIGDTILITEKGEPLWNIRQLADGTYELFAKASGKRFIFNPVMGSGCQQKTDEQESRYCHECHAVER